MYDITFYTKYNTHVTNYNMSTCTCICTWYGSTWYESTWYEST